jgi:hypothetical protein
MDEAEEREHVRLAIEGIRKLTGRPPVGWFNGRPSANTRRLLVAASFTIATRSTTSYPTGRSQQRK